MQEEEDGKNGADQTRTDFWRDPRPTNENPNFVSDYFAASRLHFIGSFRARYESMMVAVGNKLGVKPGQLLQSSAEKGLLSSKNKPSERVIVHIDMDCFFASIAVKKDLSLAGKCIAVCHGGGEISSCSYEARKFGVRAGMFFRSGRKLCPDLLSVPYNFPMYEEASIQIYAIFYDSPGVCVEAVSVDEAYLDVTLAIGDDRNGSQSGADALVQSLRTNIAARTGCTASAGIGPSKLIARLATKAAKPNGQLRVRQENVIAYLDTLKVKDLPGIGWRTTRRLDEKGVTTLPQLRALSLADMQSDFGERQGQVFYNLARALDARLVEPLKPRKSIGAEASWGVRFTKEEDEKARKFIMDMADEVAGRVEAAGAYGSKVVFKEYKRKPNSSMVGHKHLGHGPCSIFTRSAKLQPKGAGRSLKDLLRQACLRLHDDLGVRSEELRGVGVQMTDLSFADLNFDHTLAATAGSTRRIDSFFEAVASSTKPNATAASRKVPSAPSALETTELVSLTAEQPEVQQWKDGTLQTEQHINDEVHRMYAREQEDNGKGGDAQAVDEDVAAEIADDSDEDRIEVGRAPERRWVREPPGEHEDITEQFGDVVSVDIPEGWDRNVFGALPKELQAELLKDSNRRVGAQSVTGAGFAEDGEDSNRGITGRRAKRRREAKARQAAVQAEKRKRRKMSAQVTMTQIAEISELKEKGHDVLDAEEFREKPLRDCMELLGDLRGKPLNVRTIRKGRSGVNENVEEEEIAGVEGKDDEDGLDIPSPPSLSSDSESSYSVTDALLRQGLDQSQIYEDEDVWDYAEILERWMGTTADDIKSGHVEVVRGRALELLGMKKLERLCTEMRIMGKYAGQDGMEGWVEHFNGVVEEVQEECKRLYKFKLALRKVE